VIGCLLLPQPVGPDTLYPVLADFSPVVEWAGPAIYLDLAGLVTHRPAALLEALNRAVRQTIHQSPGVGLAGGKFPARVAATSLGAGRGLVITPGCEAGFLRPLPVGLLPLPAEMARQFRLLGLETLGQLAALPPGAVLDRFGREGRALQRLAQGNDDRPLRPYKPQPALTAHRLFDPPLTNRLALDAAVAELLTEPAVRLQAEYRLAGQLTLALRLADDTQLRESLSFRQPTHTPARMALAAQGVLARLQLTGGVTEIQVTLAGLVARQGEQPGLFGGVQAQKLQAQLPDLLARFGPERLFVVELTTPEAHLPEQRFRLRPVERE
jgi:protein ImuB